MLSPNGLLVWIELTLDRLVHSGLAMLLLLLLQLDLHTPPVPVLVCPLAVCTPKKCDRALSKKFSDPSLSSAFPFLCPVPFMFVTAAKSKAAVDSLRLEDEDEAAVVVAVVL